MLLGLLREEEGLGARTLGALGVTLDHARERVVAAVGRGEGGTTGQIPFTPRAKQTLELSLREANALGHSHIGTEHVLLALARQDAGVGAGILHELGFDADRVHAEVLSQLGGRRPGVGAVRAVHPGWPAAENVPARRRSLPQVGSIVVGWVLFGVALGFGILVGWAIWGA